MCIKGNVFEQWKNQLLSIPYSDFHTLCRGLVPAWHNLQTVQQKQGATHMLTITPSTTLSCLCHEASRNFMGTYLLV